MSEPRAATPAVAPSPSASSPPGSASSPETPTASAPAVQSRASAASGSGVFPARPSVMTHGSGFADGLDQDDEAPLSRGIEAHAGGRAQTRSQAQLDLLSKIGASSTPRVRALERQLAQVSSVATGLATSQASSAGGSRASSLPGPGFIPPVESVGGEEVRRLGGGSPSERGSRRASVASSLVSDDSGQVHTFRAGDAATVGDGAGLKLQPAGSDGSLPDSTDEVGVKLQPAGSDDSVPDSTDEVGVKLQPAGFDDSVPDSTDEVGVKLQPAGSHVKDQLQPHPGAAYDDAPPETSQQPAILGLSDLPSLGTPRSMRREQVPSTHDQDGADELLAAALGTLPAASASTHGQGGEVSWQALLLGGDAASGARRRASSASSSSRSAHRRHKTAPGSGGEGRALPAAERSGSASGERFAGMTASHVAPAPGLLSAELLALQRTIALAREAEAAGEAGAGAGQARDPGVGDEDDEGHWEDAGSEGEGASETPCVAHKAGAAAEASGVSEQDSGMTSSTGRDVARQSTAFDRQHAERHRHSSFSGVSQLESQGSGVPGEAGTAVGRRAAAERGGVQSASASRAVSPRTGHAEATRSASGHGHEPPQRPTHRRATTQELSKSTLNVLTSAMATLQDEQFLALSSSDDDDDDSGSQSD
jgi:hypothetical protein